MRRKIDRKVERERESKERKENVRLAAKDERSNYCTAHGLQHEIAAFKAIHVSNLLLRHFPNCRKERRRRNTH